MGRQRVGNLTKLAFLGAGLLFVGLLARVDGTPVPDGKTIKPFVLNDAAGKAWSLTDQKDKKAFVVLFLGTQCPVNNSFAPHLAGLQKQFAAKGVAFVGVNSNHLDSAKDIADHAKKFNIPFPVLSDPDQKVADNFGATRVPEAFVLDAKFNVVYQGRIDDMYGIGYLRPAPTRQDMVIALNELLAGNKVTKAHVPVEGCFITRAPAPKAQQATVTYAKDVSRIIQNRCQECHRPSQIGPMPLLTYADAAGWSAMIKEVVTNKIMPPWHADPKHGKFTNDRSLPKQELDTLVAWVDQGCPKGDDKDLPAQKKYNDGWIIGKPDAMLTMPTAYKVPAKAPSGGIPYQHFIVQTNFKEDMYVQAMECKPGAPAVVHHIIVFTLGGNLGPMAGLLGGFGGNLDLGKIGGLGGLGGFGGGGKGKGKAGGDGSGGIFDAMNPLVVWVPGDRGTIYPPGHARKIAKGATMVFQMHYTPNGLAQDDKSSVGLIFAKEPPKVTMQSQLVIDMNFAIPPGAEDYKVSATTAFKQDVTVYSLYPHMHVRGKSFEYSAVYPDGKRELLLSVPRYDFAWQTTYLLEKPLKLPAGSKLECVGHFDNSTKNLNNPDPNKTVRFGLQTNEEMMAGVAEFSYIDTSSPAPKAKKGKKD